MKRLCHLLCATAMTLNAMANTEMESFNVVSDDIIGTVHDVQIVRPVNGGTVIIPEFDETCPEEMKAPFAYACKIVEEYLPSCMPLRVAVSCGRVNSSSDAAISRVAARHAEEFGDLSNYRNLPLSMIKAVIVAELAHNSYETFYYHVPDVEFLTEAPDITIRYNEQMLDEMSFSLNLPKENQYDFVSVAMRDLLIGLGFSSAFWYDKATDCLLNPSHKLTPFEVFISDIIGWDTTSSKRLSNATCGYLLLGAGSGKLKLYAPKPWVQGVSLNYFIPQQEYSVTQILSYEFGKGTVARSLSDKYANDIFGNILKWEARLTVSTDNPTSITDSGNTADVMPYNGSIDLSFGSKSRAITFNRESTANKAPSRSNTSGDFDDVVDYINQFHPLLNGEGPFVKCGLNIAILKKDGTWDVVKKEFVYELITDELPFNYSLNMSDLEFHYGSDEYARTIDGYLRARMAVISPGVFGPKDEYRCKYFVIDYLPQQIKLSYKRNVSSTSKSSEITKATPYALTNNVRLYFGNLEGATRVVLERLRPGTRIPSKTEITDFNKGYYDTTISSNTIFTAVAYNANGSSRSVAVEVKALTTVDDLKFKYDGEKVELMPDSLSVRLERYDYSISKIAATNSGVVTSGTTDGTIDVSGLGKGVYVLTVNGATGAAPATFKFKK